MSDQKAHFYPTWGSFPGFAVRMLSICLLISGITACIRHSPSNPSNFNVICISIDSLRVDFVGFNGMPDPVSPFLDSLSRDSINFTDVMTQAPSTFFSHRAIFLSRYIFAQHRNIPVQTETLAGQLQRGGW